MYILYVLLSISPLEKVLQLLFWTVFFIWGTKKVVAGCVGQVVVLYSNGCMGICLGGLSIGHLRWVVILQKWLLGQVWLYMYFYSIHICINTVHPELKILFQLPMALLLLHSCFFLFGTQTWPYGSLMVLQLSYGWLIVLHLLTLTVNG